MAIHRFVIEGTDYEVNVGHRSGDSVRVSVNGKAYDVEIAGVESAAESPVRAPRVTAAAAPASLSKSAAKVRAPISGVVLRIDVEPGQKVTRGNVLLILEAMKMENEIFAAADGVVQSIEVKPNQDVREGDIMIVMATG